MPRLHNTDEFVVVRTLGGEELGVASTTVKNGVRIVEQPITLLMADEADATMIVTALNAMLKKPETSKAGDDLRACAAQVAADRNANASQENS